MKITEIYHLYYPSVGGIQNVITQVSEGLVKYYGEEVNVVTSELEHRRGHVESINGVTIYRLSSVYNMSNMPVSFSCIFQMKKYIADSDIVHIHMPTPLNELGVLLSGYKGKLVIWWHSDVVRQKNSMHIYYPVMRRIMERADVIIAATEGHILYSKYLKPYESKCMVIPFAIRESVQKASQTYLKNKKNSDYKAGELKLLFVGRMVYYKGIDILLQALAEINDPQISATIVGTGVLEADLKKKTHDLKLDNQVVFKGQISDEELYQEYEQCDVFVLPSTEPSEAYALVQMEAMAFAKPVINTNLKSGVPYVSIHNKTGITCRPKDTHSLAEAICWMKNHPKERKQFGVNARNKVEKEYMEDVMIRRVHELYEKIL